jgi:uncharacterized protein (TIRG00374 family)
MFFSSNRLKIILSIIIGLGFLGWTLWNVDFAAMGTALSQANYFLLIPILLSLFLSHWLRALRWQYLLDPVKHITVSSLFSALIIGYMANTFMPAHLGEFVRAYILGKKEAVSTPQTFSTIVVERIIDMFSFLLLMALAIMLYPFPEWVTQGGYWMFFGTMLLLIFLILLKTNSGLALRMISFILTPFPHKIKEKVHHLLESFIGGLNGLKGLKYYFLLFITSILIWVGYGAVLYLAFFMFNFELGILAALVILVITTVGVIVPNSPGYVGTYHKLCQLGLGLFSIPAALGASFAIIVHAVNFVPVLVLGLILMAKEGLSLNTLKSREALESNA